jgi:hypothetical protein
MPVLLSLSIIGMVCAAATAAAAWFIHRDDVAISAWPTTSGVVLISEARHTSAETADHRRQLAWMPFVQYRYTVAGTAYTSENISPQVFREFASSIDSPPTAKTRAVVERYPAGATVSVRYNPRSPAFSFLEIDRTGARVIGYVSAAFGLAALGCLLAWARGR